VGERASGGDDGTHITYQDGAGRLPDDLHLFDFERTEDVGCDGKHGYVSSILRSTIVTIGTRRTSQAPGPGCHRSVTNACSS
jgi:hypothetical protein